MWSAQAARDSKIDHTQRHLSCTEPEARSSAMDWHWNTHTDIVVIKYKMDARQIAEWRHIQGVNDIDCQKNMGDTSQSTYQKCLIQFCSISYFNFYVLKPDVFSMGTVTYVCLQPISCLAPYS